MVNASGKINPLDMHKKEWVFSEKKIAFYNKIPIFQYVGLLQKMWDSLTRLPKPLRVSKQLSIIDCLLEVIERGDIVAKLKAIYTMECINPLCYEYILLLVNISESEKEPDKDHCLGSMSERLLRTQANESLRRIRESVYLIDETLIEETTEIMESDSYSPSQAPHWYDIATEEIKSEQR